MSEANSGLLGSIKRLLSTLISVASTRLELLANELHEERLHLGQMLLCFLLVLFCFAMALMLLTVFIVVLFWDSHRLAVLGSVCVLFIVAGVFLVLKLRRLSQIKSKLFSVSLAEFAKDREQLCDGHVAE